MPCGRSRPKCFRKLECPERWLQICRPLAGLRKQRERPELLDSLHTLTLLRRPLDGRQRRAYVFAMRDESPNDATTSGGGDTGLFPWLAWTLVLFLVVYPLSVGPVAKIVGPNPPAFVRTIYTPMEYLYDHSEPVRSFYDWYKKVWRLRF